MRFPRLPGSLAAGLLAAGVAAATFGGCGSGKPHVAIPPTTLKAPRPVTTTPSGGPTTSTSSTTAPRASTTTATTAGASTPPGSATGSGAPTSNPTTPPAATPACPTAGLTATVGGPTDAGAGSVSYVVAFQNTGSATCLLSGYPGVSAVDGSGNQIGAPATRTGVAAQTVTLTPGARASAVVRASQAANYGASCQEQTSAGLRIYPPGQTAPLSVALGIGVCANAADATLQINPVVPGVTTG